MSFSKWEEFREGMPITRRWAYFDHAAVAPLPAVTRQALNDWADQAACDGDAAWPEWQQRLEGVRRNAAQLIHASPEEIAFIPSTTAGITLVAEGYPWRSGDNVVTFANEFSSNLYPWMNLESRGVELRRVPVDDGIPDLQRLEAACDTKTRIVSVSWVGYASGWRMDVAAVADIAHRQGALFFLDAIQGLGVYPLDLASIPVDFLAADGHKWLLGPEGAGLFFVRKKHLELLRPIGIGWNSVVNRYDFHHVDLRLRPDAARYEGGSANMVGFHGLGASLEWLLRFGAGPATSAIGERVVEVANLACESLQRAGARIVSPRMPPHESGIVVFDVPDRSPAAVRQACSNHQVVVSCRGGGVRISPHAYNNEADIDRLLEAIASCA